MSKYCFLTIDTEEDEWGSIGISNPSVKNISCLELFQEKCNEYGIIPTYLIDYPVAVTGASRKVLDNILSTGKCEIGTHCHPWNTPPIVEEQSNLNSFMCNLPKGLVEEKLGTLHETIQANFGVNPVVFRAGRWGFGKEVLAVLEQLAYKVDTSITPFYSWCESGGPDFNCKLTQDFYLNVDHFDAPVDRRHNGKILEIPPTMGYLQHNERFCDNVRTFASSYPFKYFKINGIIDWLGLINYRWLSPEVSNENEIIKLAERQFANGGKFINMFFHSNSLLPGLTPFVQDAQDLKSFYHKLDVFFQYIVKKDVESVPLSYATEICPTNR